MDLILWRHAEAEDGEPDEARALTAKGRRQAAKMGEWLARNLPDDCRILVSPAVRAMQTAEALGRKFKTHEALAPDSTAENILAVAHWPYSREPVLVVGHQPALGQLTALLLSGRPQEWTLRKASVCWISQKGNGETPANYIKVILGPDMVGR
jgi:phosphohistidine phosphatase